MSLSDPDLSSYKSIFNSETLVRKGLCPVSTIRRQKPAVESHSLYFEQHGNGPEKILFIMGLNSSSFGWLSQIEYFGRLPGYSAIAFDNRGVGHSDAPRGPYSTSGMAEDSIVLLDYLGWTGKRDIHVVGISLGGMIAQELATRIPERIASLTLTVTTPGGRPWNNLPPWKGFSSLARLLVITEPMAKIAIVLDMLYPSAWLAEKSAVDPEGRTNMELQIQGYLRRFEVTPLQTPMGAFSQMHAGLGHHVTPARLSSISSTIPKVTIVTGDQDNLVPPANSKYMKEHMREAEYLVFEDTGHAINVQRKERYNALLERVFAEGREKARAEGYST